MENTKKILKRIAYQLGLSTNKQLANYLGISYETLNTWIQRDNIPFRIITKIAQDELFSYDWLLTGKGEKFLNDEKNKYSSINMNNVDNKNGNLAVNSGNININNNEKRTIKTIDDVTENDLEILKYFKRLSPKKQEYYFYQIKADVLKDEIDNDLK